MQSGGLPAVFFCFSRRRCEMLARSLKLDFTASHVEKSRIHVFCKVSTSGSVAAASDESK